MKTCLECGDTISQAEAICKACREQFGLRPEEVNPIALLEKTWKVFRATLEMDGQVKTMSARLVSAEQARMKTEIAALEKRLVDLIDKHHVFQQATEATLGDVKKKINQLAPAVADVYVLETNRLHGKDATVWHSAYELRQKLNFDKRMPEVLRGLG